MQKAEAGTEEGIELIEKVRTLRESQEEELEDVYVEPIIEKALNNRKPQASDMEVDVNFFCSIESCKVVGGSLLSEIFSNINRKFFEILA